MLIAVPAPLTAGALVDRVGPKTVAVATNATRVVGFLGYLFVHDLATLIAVALLVSVSDRLFWVAQLTLIGEVRRLREPRSLVRADRGAPCCRAWPWWSARWPGGEQPWHRWLSRTHRRQRR